MAIVHKDNGFGNGEATVKVADPIVLSTALPRFLSPGDSINVPVTISNTTQRLLKRSKNIRTGRYG